MFHLIIIHVLLAFLWIGVLAAPNDHGKDHKGDDKGHDHYSDCLTDSEARFLVDTFNYFYVRFVDPAIAEKYMTPDFHEYSDSYITLFLNGSKPLGGPVSASRGEFIQNHLQTDPVYPEGTPNWFLIERIFHTCTKIAFRWVLPPQGQLPASDGPLPIHGDDIMLTEKANGRWLMKAEWSEFNTYAWAQNIGICATETNV